MIKYCIGTVLISMPVAIILAAIINIPQKSPTHAEMQRDAIIIYILLVSFMIGLRLIVLSF
jgi:hypothetical protein